jgi:hypothetical protein
MHFKCNEDLSSLALLRMIYVHMAIHASKTSRDRMLLMRTPMLFWAGFVRPGAGQDALAVAAMLSIAMMRWLGDFMIAAELSSRRGADMGARVGGWVKLGACRLLLLVSWG